MKVQLFYSARTEYYRLISDALLDDVGTTTPVSVQINAVRDLIKRLVPDRSDEFEVILKSRKIRDYFHVSILSTIG